MIHSGKISTEKDAFVDKLFEKLNLKEELKNGTLKQKSDRFHKLFLYPYLIKHYMKEDEFSTEYPKVIFNNLIEAECLFTLGFFNSGMSMLRGALESAFKLIYYETHPIEYYLHEQGKYSLTGREYREYIYIYPNSDKMDFFKRDLLENKWSTLCKYVHCDINEIETMGLVSDINSVFNFEDRDFEKLLKDLKYIVKIIISIFLMVKPCILKDMGKDYYDFLFTIYVGDEKRILIETYSIA